MSRARACAVAALTACLGATTPVLACPCQASAGPGASVTAAYQTWGTSLATSGRWVHGAWDSDGEYASLREDSSQWMLEMGLTVAYRPLTRLELAVRAGAGHQEVTAPGLDSSSTRFGDTALRLRWEVLDEPMPLPDAPRFGPALALIGAFRMPTGPVVRVGEGRSNASSGTTGAIGSTASNQGLGAWEPSVAVDVQQTFARRIRLGVIGEAAYRFPDSALGLDRHLGPRALGQAHVDYLPSVAWAFGLTSELAWEGPVAYDGERRTGTATRLWTLGAFANHSFIDAGIRVGAFLGVAPPVDTVSVNAIAATSLTLSVGYAE